MLQIPRNSRDAINDLPTKFCSGGESPHHLNQSQLGSPLQARALSTEIYSSWTKYVTGENSITATPTWSSVNFNQSPGLEYCNSYKDLEVRPTSTYKAADQPPQHLWTWNQGSNPELTGFVWLGHRSWCFGRSPRKNLDARKVMAGSFGLPRQFYFSCFYSSGYCPRSTHQSVRRFRRKQDSKFWLELLVSLNSGATIIHRSHWTLDYFNSNSTVLSK